MAAGRGKKRGSREHGHCLVSGSLQTVATATNAASVPDAATFHFFLKWNAAHKTMPTRSFVGEVLALRTANQSAFGEDSLTVDWCAAHGTPAQIWKLIQIADELPEKFFYHSRHLLSSVLRAIMPNL
jgi:hypothetical protein